MYPDPKRTPPWEIPNYNPYITWVFIGFFIPKNPKVEHDKYHGAHTARGKSKECFSRITELLQLGIITAGRPEMDICWLLSLVDWAYLKTIGVTENSTNVNFTT